MYRLCSPPRSMRGTIGTFTVFAALAAPPLGAATFPHDAPVLNDIAIENALPGNPPSEWDVAGAGDASIQGFAIDISVAPGETIAFKIDTDATDYRLDIYRMGYYGGLGARKVATVQPTATLPQVQPACLSDAGTGLTDCGNWAESASWSVPANAVSGIYFAKLVREDPEDGRASHIAFVVRDDDSGSDLLFQTSDTTWQAYNTYGGNSLYAGSASAPPVSRAHKVSYNRPFVTRGGPSEDWVFNAEYPMVRWLEANGYDVSYSTGIDTDRRGAELLEHRVFLSLGHDEYWSAAQRTAVEAARDAGVHLAFLSGNEIYWKIRWEPSTDGSATPYRTLVCYKEGTLGEIACGGKCDPLPNVWTGLWRDGCAFTPPADGCNPENRLSGQISWVGSTAAIQVPGAHAPLRFWRDTSIASLAPNQTATLTAGSLGYEWNPQQYDAFYPGGRVFLSNTDVGGQRHHLTLYRHASGALVFGAGSVQWSWGLDGNHDRGGSTPDARMQQATVNLLAEMGATAATLQAGLVAAVPSGDATPPVTAIGFPLDGGRVSSGVPVSISGTASDVLGVVGRVEVSVDGGATWSTATGTGTWSFGWTPGAPGNVTLRARGVDDWGNLDGIGDSVAVAIDPAPPAPCPCSIWGVASAAGPDGGDASAIEVGVKFRSDVDAGLAGVRFYKHAASTGTHVGKLWSAAGTLLASATFTGETTSGWQEVLFDSAVALTANTTYVASVFLPNGHYAFTSGYFASAGVDNPPLHALQNGVDGPNGVYSYAASGGFPTQTYQSSNYWVDVVLETEAGPDTTPPVIVGIAPGNGAGGIAPGANVTVTFSEAMDPASIDGASFELRDPGSALVASAVTYNAATRTATLDPNVDLEATTTYTATVRGGAVSPHVTDLAGNALAATSNWSFTTAAPPPPPPDEGPGGPVLVVATSTDAFGRYFAEILRCEGLNAFTVTDIALVSPALLAQHDVVILASMSISGSQVTMFTDWVTAGGNLIAVRPDPQLASLLGITPAGSTLAEGYIGVDTAVPPGEGITAETMQFHGTADLYTLAGATRVATLYTDASTATANPAVVLRSVGPNGGQAAAFAYDLVRSIVYTRQGNPAWAGQERDGVSPIRSDDLFFGAAAGDPQPDWVNLAKVAIPQADEQQRLLANMILHMSRDRLPLPRFWYLPRGHRAVVLMTGDDHGSGGTVQRFDTYLTQSPAGCSLDDWECLRASSYIYPGTAISDAQALAFHNQGFEVGVHVNTGCSNWTQASLDADYATQIAQVSAQLPSVPSPSTHRTHCIAWSEWATQAAVSVAHGIRLDTNYYYWPPGWVQDRPGMFTGSGMPMRFADLDGSMIDCYQATTQMTDESGQSYPFTIDRLLDRALGPEGYYGVFCANMHTDFGSHAGSDAIVASALARGVPVVSGRQMLEWLDGRNSSSFESLNWNGTQLAFTLAVGAGARNLRGMLPASSVAGPLVGLTRDALPLAYTLETIKGIAYAVFPATAGDYEATYAPDTTPPVLSAVAASPGGGGTALITWTSDEPADSRVDYGVSPGTLDQNVVSPALVTAHSVLLTGLAAETTYHFRVTSADAIANAATSPAPPDPPASFTMPPPVCFEDDTVTDFAAGTAGASTYVAATDDGEVILAPAEAAEFEGTALPAGWGAFPWSGGGTAVVGGGLVVLDGTRVNPIAASGFAAGRSLEFVATFRAAVNQHVGFGAGNNDPPGEIFNTTPFILLSTGADGAQLRARTLSGGETVTLLGASFFAAPHRYRIDWNVSSVDFSIDGALVASHAVAVAGPMRPAASDLTPGGAALDVDWIRMTPYAAAGSFTSRVFDAGGPAAWGAATWTSALASGTSLSLSVRTGNTPVPDGTWSAFLNLPTSGSTVGGSSRYIQYRADLATTDPGRTPVLEDLAISCVAGADTMPPVITDLTAIPDPGGTSALVTWTTDEPADSRVDYGTTPGNLNANTSLAPFVTVHSIMLAGLTPNTTYWFRATSADPSANAATEPAPPALPASFTTPAAPATPCAADDSTLHFALGAVGTDTYVTQTEDGEVTLRPASGAEFEGEALPGDWVSTAWGGGGSSTVTGGALFVDGARAHTVPAPGFGPGRVLEFVATFAAAPFQHVGFGGGNDAAPGEIFDTAPWAIFSSGSGGTSLLARTWDGGPFQDTTIPGSFLGSSHRYRIEWNPTNVDFYVDGTLVASHVTSLAGPMRPAASDFSTGGAVVRVDWIRMTPYAAAGSFTSRVHDAGATVQWDTAAWTSALPPGTSLGLLVRTGDVAVPDGTWTGFAPIATSGAAIGASSRYLQYRADLATSDVATTPELADVVFTCFNCDTSPPDAVAALDAAPLATGNDADGTIRVQFDWPDVEPGATVHVYRKGFGDYPEYATGSDPAAPTTPAAALAAGWTLTDVTQSGQTDEPPTRDHWSYVAFVQDACGNNSAVSNRSSALNYFLGDFTDGVTLGQGNNLVSTEDLSALGARYGACQGNPLFVPDLDIGPTTDMTVQARPTPDNCLNFEELVLLAVNYTFVLPKSFESPAAAASNALHVRATARSGDPGSTLEAVVTMQGDGRVQALGLELAWNPDVVEPVDWFGGELLQAQGGPHAFLSPHPGALDVALLGRRPGIAGAGVLATATFRISRAGDPGIRIQEVQARDRRNRSVEIGVGGEPATPELPRFTTLHPNIPNPFNPSTATGFDLASPQHVQLLVHAVDGRLVRTLVDAWRPAGRWTVVWDGRGTAGERLASGVYFVRLVTSERTWSRRMVLLK